jgi:hypothetical protein
LLLFQAVQDDSGYKADDDKSVGDDDEVYLGQPAGGDESGIQAVLLLVPDEVGFFNIMVHSPGKHFP